MRTRDRSIAIAAGSESVWLRRMFGQSGGSWRLFRAFGVQVSLHWTWLLVAVFAISGRQEVYSSVAWNAAEYLALFAIVLLHEFGHALACRSVGGRAEHIVLWPLGGIAFVSPPQRPGAVLWSIAAGPLVNVALVPVFLVLGWGLNAQGYLDASPDLAEWLFTVSVMNLLLLVFNLLPVYPLDGGQILRSVLWFAVGPRRSLLYASAVGLVGVAGLVVLAFYQQSLWLGVLALFIGSSCWSAFQASRENPPPPPTI